MNTARNMIRSKTKLLHINVRNKVLKIESTLLFRSNELSSKTLFGLNSTKKIISFWS